MHRNFFGAEVDFENVVKVWGSTYVFPNMQKINFQLMFAFSVFSCLVSTQSEKKTGGVYLCKLYLVFAFWNSSHGVQANDYKRTCVGVLTNKYWNKQLMTFFTQAYGIQIWFVGVFLLLAYSVQKQKCQSCPIFSMFLVLCAVGGLLSRNLKFKCIWTCLSTKLIFKILLQ